MTFYEHFHDGMADYFNDTIVSLFGNVLVMENVSSLAGTISLGVLGVHERSMSRD